MASRGLSTGARVAGCGALIASLFTACSNTSSATVKWTHWDIRPGVKVLTVTDSKPGEPLTLYSDAGKELLTVKSDKFGQASFPFLPEKPMTVQAGPRTQVGQSQGSLVNPGTYFLRDDSAKPKKESPRFKVLDKTDVAKPSFYSEQKLHGVAIGVLGKLPDGVKATDGFQYLTMRDGVKLSAMVRFPDPSIYGKGPFPTVIETSGYGISNPDAEEPGVRIARALGYATVSVNMRGTGCSGGVFDVFNDAQMADGYDMVEIVAAQPWVLHGRPGMVGLSYSGITQLYTASTRPPHLAAVSPQSVIIDPWLEQWPGGVYNAGFTRRWLEERDRQAAPNGQDWTKALVAGGDKVCADSQRLRNLNLDFQAFGKSLAMRPVAADARDLRKLVPNITVPTYLSGAFQDEQTGPQFGVLIPLMKNVPDLRVQMWNGRHPDGYAPSHLMRWFEFLEFYVAQRVPKVNPVLRAGLPPEMAKNFNLNDTDIGPDRFAQYGNDYAAALAAYRKELPISVSFESGAGGNEVGEPVGTFERQFASWPPKESKVNTFYLGADHTMSSTAPTSAGSADFGYDANAGALSFIKKDGDGGLLSRIWDFDWTKFDPSKSAVFETPAFTSDVVLAGPAEADLQMKVAGATDADMQVTLSEVRPDGIEYLLQTGWLRLGHRKTTSPDTELNPERTYEKVDYEPVPEGKAVRARISIPPTGAPIRAGSKLKMTVSTPGRDRAEWTFENPTFATGSPADVKYSVLSGGATPSRLMITVLDAPGTIPARLPACPSLRGQACRKA